MIIATSLSPKHSNAANQQAAVDSWQHFGKCVSFNTESEYEDVSHITGVEISTTHKTVNGIIGKKLININVMIDYAIYHNDDLLLINSDIIINALPVFNNSGITIISRHDYTNVFGDGKIFAAGFDVFFIPKQLLHIFPPSIYAMGVAWWDYWIPYQSIKAKIPVFWPKGNYAYHKLHPTQYSHEEWVYMGEYFKWQFKLGKHFTIGQIASQALSFIQSNTIR